MPRHDVVPMALVDTRRDSTENLVHKRSWLSFRNLAMGDLRNALLMPTMCAGNTVKDQR